MTQIQMIHIAFELWGTVFCLLLALIVNLIRSKDERLKISLTFITITTAILNICEATAFYYRGNITHLGGVMVRVTNFLFFLFGHLLIIECSDYLNRVITLRRGIYNSRYVLSVAIVEGIGIVLLICSRIWKFYYAFDEENRYYRLDNYWGLLVIEILGIVIIFINTVSNIKYFRPSQAFSFIAFEIAPILTLIFQFDHYGVSFYNVVIVICIIFLVITYIINNGIDLREERVHLLEKEVELNRERVRLYHSQIQPHFIFNSLTLLRSHLDEPEKAEQILNELTSFLRKSVDMFAENDSIPVSREISLVENYISMGNERFGDKIDIEIDIKDTDFEVPPFAIQTIVENAMVHGVRKNKDGKGHIDIKTYREGENHVVEVNDNGPGFDVSILENINYDNDEIQHKHVGIENIRKRVELMTGGKLEIVSAIGIGTTVRIIIPCV